MSGHGALTMPVAMARIDQKLIHGQVTAAWVPFLHIQEIVVVDDLVSDDPMTQAILASGVPSSVKASFTGEAEAADWLSEADPQDLRRLIIFGSVAAAGRAVAGGLKLECLNLGNLAYLPAADCVRLSDCFYVKPGDLDTLSAMSRAGLRIFIQSVPGDPPRPFAPKAPGGL
jgi:mannose/fructose/N-acetylgalactosamine-specific phosphotransferase system component IIB